MYCLKRILIITSLIIITLAANAQKDFSIKAYGTTADFWDKHNPAIYPGKLDETGRYLLEPGIVMSFESYSSFHELFAFEIVQGLYFDAAQQFAGFSHFGVRRKFLQIWKHSVTIGFGPTFHYWQSRDNLAGYERDESITNNYGWEYRFAWISGELEYNFYLSKKSDISVAIYNIHPTAFTLAIGYTYWITRKQSKNCNCPGYGKRYRR